MGATGLYPRYPNNPPPPGGLLKEEGGGYIWGDIGGGAYRGNGGIGLYGDIGIGGGWLWGQWGYRVIWGILVLGEGVMGTMGVVRGLEHQMWV